jgi:predicted DNA repair protein MutK
MAEDLFNQIIDTLNLLTKAAAFKGDVTVVEGLHKIGGFEDLVAQLKAGAGAAEMEAADGSPDIAETKSKAAEALARARLQRHLIFKFVVAPTLWRMMKNSAKNKGLCAVFALAGLHVLQPINSDFNLSPVVDTALMAAGTYFGYKTIRDLIEKNEKHRNLNTLDLESILAEMRKLDLKATIKLFSLVGLNFYDAPVLTQIGVLSAIGVLAAVVPYGLILGMKYADMKGIDWESWQGKSDLARYWQKTGIPKAAGKGLITLEKGIQAGLPHFGRAASLVGGGRIIIKGLGMFVPLEANFDALLADAHATVLKELGVKGIVWGGAGATVGSIAYGARAVGRVMKDSGRAMLGYSKGASMPDEPSSQNSLSVSHSDDGAVPR